MVKNKVKKAQFLLRSLKCTRSWALFWKRGLALLWMSTSFVGSLGSLLGSVKMTHTGLRHFWTNFTLMSWQLWDTQIHSYRSMDTHSYFSCYSAEWTCAVDYMKCFWTCQINYTLLFHAIKKNQFICLTPSALIVIRLKINITVYFKQFYSLSYVHVLPIFSIC